MKNLLLSGLVAVSAAGFAAAPQAEAASLRPMKQTLQPAPSSATINILPRKHAVRKEAGSLPENHVLFESFEGWDGTDKEWTPEGWTVDMRGEVERADSWTPQGILGMITPSDGSSMYAINYSTNKQDEWLISPEVTLGENMQLSYYVFLMPYYLFTDAETGMTGEQYGDKKVATTLQVWAKAEGEDWVMLRDIAEDYKDMTDDELIYAQVSGLEKRTDDLAQFAGKKTQVAFRVVGIDGNTMLLDEIAIRKPELEGVTYLYPTQTLYWGFNRSDNFFAPLSNDIAVLPVYEPLTWLNYSEDYSAEYTWTYTDPVTGTEATSDEEDLTLTFYPDYTSDATKENNLFPAPMLTGSTPQTVPANYQSPVSFFQAGGAPVHTYDDGTVVEASLFPFACNTTGTTRIAIDVPELGDYALPVFGYDRNSNDYWLGYSLPDDAPQPQNYARLKGIANVFMPGASPLVVNGLTVYGSGTIADDAEFTATIYALDSEMHSDINTFTVVATAKISGADVLRMDKEAYAPLCFPFDFDEPAVVSATEEHPAYIFAFEGFNSDKVEYFLPYQSEDLGLYGWAYVIKDIDLSGHGTGRQEPYTSVAPADYVADGKYIEVKSAFAIGLNAEYPWLTTDCEGLALGADDVEVTAALGSYYDGGKLTVEAPEGLVGTVEGRYDECVLKVSRDGFNAVDGNVTVKGPGVEVTIPVKAEEAGIADVSIDGNTRVTDVYDLSGRRVSSAAKGIYLLKSSDGSVRKSLVK